MHPSEFILHFVDMLAGSARPLYVITYCIVNPPLTTNHNHINCPTRRIRRIEYLIYCGQCLLLCINYLQIHHY